MNNIIKITLFFILIIPDLTEATVKTCNDNQDCSAQNEFCDSYSSECKSCLEVCGSEKEFRACKDHCSRFMQEAVIQKLSETSKIDTIFILLIILIAVCFISCCLIFLLLCLHLKSRKRLKTIDPSVNDMQMADFNRNPSGRASSAVTTPPLGGLRGNNRTLSHGNSMQTMTTQLSSNDALNNSINRRRNITSNGRLSPITSYNHRMPSDDTVAAAAYDNSGMVTTPTDTNSSLSPNKSKNGIPYTISHSQVV